MTNKITNQTTNKEIILTCYFLENIINDITDDISEFSIIIINNKYNQIIFTKHITLDFKNLDHDHTEYFYAVISLFLLKY
jgi:hypothetical protein